MFPFTPDEQDDILIEVKLLLGNYETLLGHGLPTLNERDEDHPEPANGAACGQDRVAGRH